MNFQTVKHFRKFLSDNRENLLNDRKIRIELSDLKDFLIRLEDAEIEIRSTKASEELSKMTEEERRLLSMAPAERKFFMEYKVRNPHNPWSYFKEYQKKLQKEYKSKIKQSA